MCGALGGAVGFLPANPWGRRSRWCRDPEDGHLGVAQIDRRVPQPSQRAGLLRAHLLEARQPGRVVAEEAAAVDRHGEPEARVDAGDDAGQVAAPGDAGDADPLRIDLGKERSSEWARMTAATA